MSTKEGGFTLVELMVSLVVLAIIALAFFDLFNALLTSSELSQRESTAVALANTEMEFLKSLPYANLAVVNGPIVANQYLPASINRTVNGHQYLISIYINYVDDAYDGCGSYPTLALKELYCRNYPPPSGAPNIGDSADYKDVRVTVTDLANNSKLAYLDSYIAPGVAGTTGTNGSIFVQVIDNNGNPVSGATVTLVNNAVSPNVNVGNSTDQNGYAIFYNMPADKNYDYVVSATATGYSTITTIPSTGSLQATYPNQKLISQNSSSVTLMIAPEGQYSLLLQSTDTSGNPLPNAKIYVMGGYKDYTSTTNNQYYFDTIATNNSPVTDGNGLYGMTNLVPGNYYFCGITGSTGCSVGSTTYYLAAAVPYGGNNPLNPIIVPTYSASSPPSTTYSYNGNNYLQEVRLMLTTNSNFPRVNQLTPYSASLSSGSLSNFSFSLSGENLPCTGSSSNCGTSVSFTQNGTSYPAVCTGGSKNNYLSCTDNLSGVVLGQTQLVVTAGGNTLTLPTSPLLGGLIIGQ